MTSSEVCLFLFDVVVLVSSSRKCTVERKDGLIYTIEHSILEPTGAYSRPG